MILQFQYPLLSEISEKNRDFFKIYITFLKQKIACKITFDEIVHFLSVLLMFSSYTRLHVLTFNLI